MAKSRKPTTEQPRSTYEEKRDFSVTPEPRPDPAISPSAGSMLRFVVQKHDARRLHYDLRLEVDGAMMSWAVPKGPSYDPNTKRFAVETEDHPLAYNEFEGRIPEGEYGAGDVLVWDSGTYETIPPGVERAMRDKGHFHIRLLGDKLVGEWHLVRIKGRDEDAKARPWLFFKAADRFADPTRDIVEERPESVRSGHVATRGPLSAAGPASSRAAGVDARGLLTRIGEPMLASTGALEDAASYLFEIKYDGYRLLAAKAGAEVRLFSRADHDWSDRFGGIVEAVGALAAHDVVLDGEACAIEPDGRPSFHALQRWVGGERGRAVLHFFAFDLLFLDGRDLRALPIEERRRLLSSLLATPPTVGAPIAVSQTLPVPPGADVATLLAAIRKANLEGLVAKRRGSPYQNGRSNLWIKIKALRRQEFAVVGYTPLSGTKRSVVGALILALHDGERFQYAGKVGSGFDDRTRSKLAKELDVHLRDTRTVIPDEPIKDARWVEPTRVVEVSFQEGSPEGKPRFPTFVGMREDKRPEQCVKEAVLEVEEAAPESVPRSVPGVRVTNPDKVLFPRDGITKAEVIEHYARVAPVILPYLKDRPLTLQRWPDGIDDKAWYQQHPPKTGTPDWLRVIDRDGKRHLIADSLEALRWLGNLAALTLHGWSSRVPTLHLPDWLTLDLDPGDGPWSDVIEVALALRMLLEQLELPSIPKTSGKRGLHVFIPVAPGVTYDDTARLANHLASALARVLPNIATTELPKEKRRGRLYVDALQNAEGRTLVAPYTLRALDGAPVSAPLRWSEVTPKLDPNAFQLRTFQARLDAHGDLFAPALERKADIRPLLKKLG